MLAACVHYITKKNGPCLPNYTGIKSCHASLISFSSEHPNVARLHSMPTLELIPIFSFPRLLRNLTTTAMMSADQIPSTAKLDTYPFFPMHQMSIAGLGRRPRDTFALAQQFYGFSVTIRIRDLLSCCVIRSIWFNPGTPK